MPSSVLDLLTGWGTVLGRGAGSFMYCSLREILGFLRMWRFRLGLFVEMCLICYIFGCRRIARVVCCSLTFYFLVLLFPLYRGFFCILPVY
jgi:hypothetical protein